MADAKVKLGEAVVDKVDDLLAKYTKRVGAVTGGEPSSAALAEAEKIIAEKGAKVTPDQLLVEVKSRLEKGADLAPTKFTVKDPAGPGKGASENMGGDPLGEDFQTILPGYNLPAVRQPAPTADPGTIDVASMATANPPVTGLSKSKKAALIGGGALLAGGAAGLLGGKPTTQETPATTPEQPTTETTATGTDEDKGSKKPDPVDPDLLSYIPKLKAMKAVTDLPDTITYTGEDGKEVTERPEDMLARSIKSANDELTTLAAEYKATEDALERRELTSDLIRAVANIAAGIYGLRNGVDMSGMKFDPIDWVRRQELERAKYSDRRSATGDKLSARKDLARTLIAKRDMTRDEKIKLIDSANRVIENDNKNAVTAWDARVDVAKILQDGALKKDALTAKAAASTDKATSAALTKEAKLTGNIMAALTKASTAQAKGDDETKSAAMLQVMELNNQYKAATGRPYIAPTYFTTTSWLGNKGLAEPSDITEALTKDLTSKPTSAMVKMFHPDQGEFMSPPEDVDYYLKQGAVRR
jgi:hypothetical protein